ncbi:endonuclease Q family protein [Paraliobacillus sp. JSM ZJ581]|uniref:endonuclease Q family protein n=1 Tax=Paraliobacillus sp. JSM ZJ581 TaxID=3342118 RepID=UPI0035A8553B
MHLQSIYADLHVHVGRDKYNKPVKITGGKSLTLTNILKEASRNKGIQMVGVIDCHSPAIQEELSDLVQVSKAEELKGGGIRFEEVTLILGTEIEIYDETCAGPIHVLCFLPTLQQMRQFTSWLSTRMTNINLSSQRFYGSGKSLQQQVRELGGLFIPAHIFTPFKSLYGKGVVRSLTEVLDPEMIDAVELGLSSDTSMADQISELHGYTYLTNSDAHSLAKIAREYQELRLKEGTFSELSLALQEKEGRKVVTNYGMHPKLGKYYHTVCKNCLAPGKFGFTCPDCGSDKVIKGVAERIQELVSKHEQLQHSNRPTYIHQVPLEYIPGLGEKSYHKLLKNFGTEMEIIHHATKEQLNDVVPDNITKHILQMRKGIQHVKSGGGGKYGKLLE